MTTIGSLFTGYGGLDLAVSALTGARTEWVADLLIDPDTRKPSGPSKLLPVRFPDAPNLGDITRVDWSTVPPVDIITGGFPCQDVSMAGRRAGLAPGSRSGLWSTMAKAIDTIRPRLVVAENVRGLLSADGHADVEPCPWCMGDPEAEPAVRALGSVLGDLADIGYDAAWKGITAADVGAPHGRFRVFIIAWPADPDSVARAAGSAFDRGRLEVHQPGTVERAQRRYRVADADADSAGCQGQVGTEGVPGSCADSDPRVVTGCGSPDADPGHGDVTEWARPAGREQGERASVGAGVGCVGDDPDADSYGDGRECVGRVVGSERDANGCGRADGDGNATQPTTVQWGPFEPAVRRWESLTRAAPAPTERGPNGGQRLSPPFVEWMMGLPAGWVTDVPGLSRNEALKLLGNGVVPQQAMAAVGELLDLTTGVRRVR